MLAWITRCYRRRIVNVNVNIILAGLLAMLVMVGVVHALTKMGVPQRIARLLGMPYDVGGYHLDEKVVIGLMSFLIDLVADVGVYYALHWLANHMPRRAGRLLDQLNPAYAHLSFVKDATLVQVERLTLSPIFYVIALGGQHALLHAGMSVFSASVIPFTVAILLTRTGHTIWMLSQERRAMRRLRERSEALAAAGTTSPQGIGTREGSDTPRGGGASQEAFGERGRQAQEPGDAGANGTTHVLGAERSERR